LVRSEFINLFVVVNIEGGSTNFVNRKEKNRILRNLCWSGR